MLSRTETMSGITFHQNFAKLKVFGITEIIAILPDGRTIREDFWGSNDNEDLRIKKWQYKIIDQYCNH